MTSRSGYTLLVAIACWAGGLHTAAAVPLVDPPLETPRAITVGVLNTEPFAIPDTAMKWTGYAVVMFEASSIHARVVFRWNRLMARNCAPLPPLVNSLVIAGTGLEVGGWPR